MQPLNGMTKIIAVAEIKTGRAQDSLYHTQVNIVVRLFLIV